MFIAAVQNRIDFSFVKIDVSDMYIWAGIILAAIGAIWGIKKMIMLGYFSSGDAIPEHWQARYDKEQDYNAYREFRDGGGFEDDSEGEFIGTVRDKSWYYDSEGQVYSETDEEEDLNIGWEK